MKYNLWDMSRKSIGNKKGCALCGAKEVSEPRGEERYCRDCWDKKIAVEEIVAREFALKRYIRFVGTIAASGTTIYTVQGYGLKKYG